MPHSSGGGSHGGGSHGSSRSSGSRSGGSGGSSPSVRRAYYPGAYRYVYYNHRSRKPEYYYSTGRPDPTKVRGARDLVLILAMVVFFSMGILGAIGEAVFRPVRVTGDARLDTTIQIWDQTETGTLTTGEEQRQELQASMEAFYELTGIVPAVELVNEEDWRKHYTSFSTFAYDEYVSHFKDEKHWLFVVSYPKEDADPDFTDWTFEGMIGDDVGKCVNGISEDKMTNIFYAQMVRSDRSNVLSAVAGAFDEYSEVVMKTQVDKAQLQSMLVTVPVLVIMLIAVILNNRKQRRFNQAVKVQKEAREIECEYCRGIYVEHTVTSCPHCGAPVKISGNN
ncbi:MAG: hypothetical protein Q4B59_02935 [Lachnospiraceae bacterium]|nr:hypothetical protein [Lachnospiraceae bacterium]